MAGAGYRSFSAGAVLTAAQVNTFLMEQSVMNFAGTAARGSALASVLSAGQMAHVGGGTVTVYDGSAWKQVYPSSSMTLITSGTLSGASVVLSSIPGTYRDLRLSLLNLLPATDGAILYLRVNGDSGANRHYNTEAVTSGSSATAFSQTEFQITARDNAVSQSIDIVTMPEYANATSWKLAVIDNLSNNQTTSTSFMYRRQFGAYNQTAAITSLTLLMSTGNFTSGTYALYGVG